MSKLGFINIYYDCFLNKILMLDKSMIVLSWNKIELFLLLNAKVWFIVQSAIILTAVFPLLFSKVHDYL